MHKVMKSLWRRGSYTYNHLNNINNIKMSIQKCFPSGALRRYSYCVAPMIMAEPSRGLVDEPVKLEIRHLRPNRQVTLQSRLLSEDADWWEAYGHYVSNSEGIVQVARDKSCGGTYTGQEPMGLIWSMKLVPGSRPGMRLRKKNVTVPYLITISVYDGWISRNFDKEAVLASVVLERSYMAPGITRLELKEGPVFGTVFFPPGPGPFPAVLDMWGGGGGLVEYRAALLASRGFATLALAYLGHKNIPQSLQIFDPELSYFKEAFKTLNNHPKVSKGNVAILGLSLGFTLALLMATEVPNIHPKCLVCISGSHYKILQEGGTNILPELLKDRCKIKFTEDGSMIWRNVPLPFPDDPKQMIQVDKIRCPLMLIFGEDDQNWPAHESAVEIRKILKAAGKEHLLTTLSYPQTGHLIEPPYSPHFRESKFKVLPADKAVTILWGGQAKPHSDAQEDSWKKILVFLEEHLVFQHAAAVVQSQL
ncbi:peroxisomal succinyl-coenzyme A thioesterase-like isoform X2 [Stegostoma tigrinum]|uniref:peroxisomal succinyl-coenzyme A thioesterase-like isoform X2 n=1 Tax=Stegostoma tigrinum TaxID=3053191 RepID=UPI00202B43A2|nr:peroxisomal succinyl-coenzyme A thioesterase-like isoform X2 [Stegostoma tigrinum]